MCYNLEKIKHILKSVMKDIDFVEGKLKDLVYQDQSQFSNLELPKELHINFVASNEVCGGHPHSLRHYLHAKWLHP